MKNNVIKKVKFPEIGENSSANNEKFVNLMKN